MKTVVTALLESVGSITNVAIVVVIVWLMFAILAMNLFGGKFESCSVDAYNIGTREDCDQKNGVWFTYDHNFDSVGEAMITLFIISSLEGWPDIMYIAVDSTGVAKGPKIDSTPYAAYFFLIFILIGSFFFLNFFVGVIFLNFEEA
jgi:hypothetical protein